MPRQPLKSRKSYRQVPITETRCGSCTELEHLGKGFTCKATGNMFAPEELVPKNFAALCEKHKPVTS